MADVSLDDLIKKDREKDKVNRLKQVTSPSLRNSNPKESSIDAIKTKMIGREEATTPTRRNSSRRDIMKERITAETTDKARNKQEIDPNPSSKREKKLGKIPRKSFAPLKSWV